jgi:general secretion pathway protein L
VTEKRIVGLDIGTYSVKVIYLEPKGDLSVLGFEREPITETPAPPPVPAETSDEEFDDAPTEVREAPGDDEDTIPHGEALPDEDKAEGEGASESAEDEAAASDEIELDDTPAWQHAVRRLSARGALDGEVISTFVPESKGLTVQLDVPFEDEAKVSSVLPHLLMDRLPVSQTDIVWDFETYPRAESDPEEGAHAIVGYAQNDDVEEILARLAEENVDPAILGIPELFLAQYGVRANGGPQEDPVAFVDLGHETTRVVVVRGWDVLLARTIRSGGRQVTDAIADAFSQPFDEAEKTKHTYGAVLDEGRAPNPQMQNLSDAVKQGLRPVVRDLRRTFQGLFARRRVEIGRVLICGGTSQIKNIEKYLSAELGIEARRLPMLGTGLVEQSSQAVAPLALAAGLVQQSEAARNRVVNLRKGRFAYRGRSSYLRRQLGLFAAAVAGLILVLGVTMWVQKASHEAKRDAMKTALEEQTKALLGKELTSKATIQKAMLGEESGGSGIVPKMSAYELLYELVNAASKDIELELDRIEVDADRNLVQIYGETTDAQAVDKLVSDLEKIECLKEIKKDKLRVRDEKADFELQISSGCS